MACAGISPGSTEERNRWMLRARDAIDRGYARPLSISALAGIALVSEAHFTRTFRTTFGGTPHRYLQRRRVERARALPRPTARSVTHVCFAVRLSGQATLRRPSRRSVREAPSAFP